MAEQTEYQAAEARSHFLRNIRQIGSNCILMRRDERGRMKAVYASESFAEMMECSVEDALRLMDGTGFFRTTHPEDRPFERSLIRRRVADDGTSDLTVQKITAKHNRIWCRIHYAFVDDFGEHYIYCTCTNVSLLKRYEERLHSVYTSLGSSFYQEDEQTLGLFRVNLTRNTVEEVRGRDLFPSDSERLPFSELMNRRAEHYPIQQERERLLHNFDRARLTMAYLEGRVSAREVLFSRRRDGLYAYVEFSAAITRHPLTSDMVAFITERACNTRKVQETLTQKILARQFDMVAYLVNGSYGVSIGDADNIPRGSIFPISRTGIYQEYLERQVFPALYGTEEERQEARDALSLETVERETRRREPYIVNISIQIDGEIFNKRFDFYLSDPAARFYIVLKSDTTETRREEQARSSQLRAALEEARQANVAKTAFLSSMSHEIRTPMNAIIGLNSLALKDQNLSSHTREQLEKIGSSAQHLLGLINDILDMSRIESGRMTLKKEEFSFRTMLDQINTMIGGQCQDKDLWYDCQVVGTLRPWYIGDDMKLKQVLINILGNAVKFTPAPGRVSLRVEQTASFDGQSTLRFTIQDTGIGMDKAYLPRIFEAFTQEDATSTNRYGGSGLGMAITKNIVEMMNGSISVESEKGVGSTFTVNVTLRDSDRQDAETVTGVNAPPENLSVLIADGDAAAREDARQVFEEIGVTADLTSGGTEMLDMIRLHRARQKPYTLLLLDRNLPELHSAEAMVNVQEAAGQEVPVVLLTVDSGYGQDGAAGKDGGPLPSGADGILRKPMAAQGILDAYRQAVERRQSEEEKKPEKADLTGRRILLAEDMAINAEIMMELLGMMDMETDHAENGKIAVDLFSGNPAGWYDAILMDMRMPELDGLSAAKAIRALDRPDAKRIPIIALTANAFDEDVQRSLQAGMNAHLTKPVEPQRLFDTLAELIEP